MFRGISFAWLLGEQCAAQCLMMQNDCVEIAHAPVTTKCLVEKDTQINIFSTIDSEQTIPDGYSPFS